MGMVQQDGSPSASNTTAQNQLPGGAVLAPGNDEGVSKASQAHALRWVGNGRLLDFVPYNEPVIPCVMQLANLMQASTAALRVSC